MFGKIKLPDAVRNCIGLKEKCRLMKSEGKLAVCVLSERKEVMEVAPCLVIYGEVSWGLRF